MYIYMYNIYVYYKVFYVKLHDCKWIYKCNIKKNSMKLKMKKKIMEIILSSENLYYLFKIIWIFI
jgi:hypothetical protein